jgi:ribonuclease T
MKRFLSSYFLKARVSPLSALYYGETVLAKAMRVAGIEWGGVNRQLAFYVTQKNTELFCKIFNTQPF